MPDREVVLVRHGETEWSRTRRHTGTTDVELTKAGRAEARALRAHLAARPWALVLTSPLQRARRTAELSGFAHAEVEADLREWDYGEYEGRTTADIRTERAGWSPWNEGFPGGEPIEAVAARCDRIVARACAASGDVLVFAHAHVLRILAARWVEQDPRFGRRLVLSTGSVSTLGWEREERAILRWNDTSPREAAR